MCCEKSKQAVPAGESAGALPLDHAEFYACLREAMHAMAQPITLLRSHFYLARESNAGTLVLQEHLADADSGMERLCAVFRLMQELVQLQSVAAELSVVPLASILSALTDDAEVVLAGSGLTFRLQTGLIPNPQQRSDPMPPPAVEADARRARHALMSMLHTVREGARPGSAVLCGVGWDGRWAEVILQPEDPVGEFLEDSLNDVARLRLALAKANALSQRALFARGPGAYAISIKLPVAIGRS